MPANTHGADINELAFGYFLNGEKWFSADAEAQFKEKKKLVSPDEFAQQMGRARAMADVSLAFIKQHYRSSVKKVWWTARPGSMSEAVGREVDQRKNPTDILVQLANKEFVGFSAKSTAGKSDIGFKNPGLGTVETALQIKLQPILESAVTKAVKQYKLPSASNARKSAIRSKPAVQAATQAMGEKVLQQIRDAMYAKLTKLDQPKLRKYVLQYWMDSSTDLFPPYYKVTGMGKDMPYTAKLEDPLNNPKLTAIKTQPIKIEKNGTSAIGVSAGSKRILKMRAKFESEKLASNVKFSGEPF